MLSNCYQKFYTNQIHSSSLLYQLSTMWKSQVLCDAVIRSGSTVIKAHRVILVAACPMLQSMEKSSIGSHLEVRLASDIAADSINTFLQYLYEGFMMLTEENCKEVEKIARLLQVDSVIKCCADFSKCVSLKTGTGNFSNEQYRYTFHDMIEFRHVRSSDLQKTVQDKLKRPSTDFLRAGSPSTKRPKHFRMGSPSDISVIADRLSMAQSYAQQEKQVNHSGAVNSSQRSNGSSQKQPVFPVEIVEDSIELVQTEVNPDTNTISVDEAVSVGIASQIDNSSDLQVIDISKDKSNHPSASNNSAAHSHHPHDSITVNPLENFANTDGALSNLRDSSFPPPLTSHRTLSTSSSRQTEDVPTLRRSKATERPPDSLPLQAMQHLTRSSNSSLVPSSPVQSSQDIQGGRSMFTTSVTSERGSKSGRAGASQTNDGRKEKSSLQGEPDLSIVKSETMDNDSTPGGLEMYVDSLDEPHDTGQRDSEADDTEGDVTGDWNKEDLSMEGNITGDQTMWVDPNFKEHGWISTPHRATEVLTQLAMYAAPPSGGLTPIEPPPLSVYVTPPNGGSSRRKKKKHYEPVIDFKESVIGKEDDKSLDDSVSADGELMSASSLVSTMTENEFAQLSSMIPSFSDVSVHCTESLQGKQKNCVLCKYLGRKTNEGLLKVRTRAKCNACDTPLCKGPPRNCFRDFHELYKKFKFPDLKWSHASVYQYPGRGANARFIITPDVNDSLPPQ
ncbi:zinc finger and BTB domain-containing protein 20-like isoform X1 [Saccostrea echinata]|uniref:zinc finger and BTB domain-containing protein 20-like isoform X1 n=1 Tax=Saccostrea echinata TaxID=191078 RepID=UPI002A83F2D0|nr:zinc finger and BTB domain-containing protein 20-like isoform X1 [Saccostrea echinata]